jgi:hypothetical protein
MVVRPTARFAFVRDGSMKRQCVQVHFQFNATMPISVCCRASSLGELDWGREKFFAWNRTYPDSNCSSHVIRSGSGIVEARGPKEGQRLKSSLNQKF